MERVRALLEVLKKYHFWILCGLIVVLSFVSWFLATEEEARLYLARKKQIEGQISLVGKIAGNNAQPSEAYIKEIRDRESGTLTNQVTNASTHLYKDMRENNLLPIVFTDKMEQEGFKAEFEKIWKPIEEIEKLPPMADSYRNRYRDHIDKHFPELFKMIDRRTVVDISGTSDPSAVRISRVRIDRPGARGGRRPPPMPSVRESGDPNKKTIGSVDWVDADEKISSFLKRYAGATTPTTLDIAMAQEELWVYETLLKVIRNTNDLSSDAKHSEKLYKKPANQNQARIKQILEMDIGKDAVDKWRKCESALFAAPSEGGDAAAAAAAAPAVQHGAGPGAPGSGLLPGVFALADRYVDDKGKPVTDPTQQPYHEFRMMPINLRVVIDQQEIPRLLAECANSAMRIDVRGVRILAEEPPAADLTVTDSSVGGTAAVEAPPVRQVPTRTRRPGGFGLMGRSKRNVNNVDPGAGKIESSYDEDAFDAVYPPVPVEVQGIIYIYNRPQVKAADETAGNNGGQTAPAAANSGAASNATGTGPTAPTTPAANFDPARRRAPTAPGATGAVTNPPTNTPASGTRP